MIVKALKYVVVVDFSSSIGSSDMCNTMDVLHIMLVRA